jgi:hypothetical protein
LAVLPFGQLTPAPPPRLSGPHPKKTDAGLNLVESWYIGRMRVRRESIEAPVFHRLGTPGCGSTSLLNVF